MTDGEIKKQIARVMSAGEWRNMDTGSKQMSDNTKMREAQIAKAARVLADRTAKVCNTDKEDNWKIYGNDFIEDVRAIEPIFSQPAQSAVVPEGWKLVPISASSRIIVAIESAIDSQLTASGMSPADMFRQDGQSVWDAAIATAPSARLAVDQSVAPQHDITDAYNGAREDMSIWKRRALEAERDLRAEKETTSRLCQELNEQNGPTFMGEPVARVAQEPTDDEIDALSYPPKALLRREDWDVATRKPKAVQQEPAQAQVVAMPEAFDALVSFIEDCEESGDSISYSAILAEAEHLRQKFAASPVLTQPSEQAQVCKTCNGHGVVGRTSGQTPENFEYASEPCPDCGEQEQAGAVSELFEFIGTFPELNMSNYTEDDVGELNVWGIELYQLAEKVKAALSASQQASERDKEELTRLRQARRLAYSLAADLCAIPVIENIEGDLIRRDSVTALVFSWNESMKAVRAAQEKKA